MRMFDSISYTRRIRWRIRGLWLVVLGMLAYMVIVGETGGGDSRTMTQLAEIVSRLIFFGGLIYILVQIYRNKKLLSSPGLLRGQRLLEQDERRMWLHDKSGGVVVDLLLVVLLFSTLTAALYHQILFFFSLCLLLLTAALKGIAWLVYDRKGLGGWE